MAEPLDFLIDRIATPIGELIIIADREGRLRTIDWTDHEARMTLLLDRYYGKGGYTLIDIAHKVVGVGSVGLRAYVALLEGSSPDDVLFLQLKQARRSVLARHVQSCSFSYDVPAITSRYALVTMRLQLGANSETVTLYHTVHLDNLP